MRIHEDRKRLYTWIVVTLLMVLVIVLWIFSLRQAFSNLGNFKGQFFKGFPDVKSLWEKWYVSQTIKPEDLRKLKEEVLRRIPK